MSITAIAPAVTPDPVERASVGRRVWFWCGQNTPAPLNVHGAEQAFDAGVLYVHADGRVNLLVTDHYGAQSSMHGVRLVNPSPTDQHNLMENGYATWMPYQVKKGTGSS